MEREDILKKAQLDNDKIGEMERKKTSKANWIAVISTAVLAIVFMFTEGFRGNRCAVYAFAAICFTWASVFYFCQYFIAKRRHIGILLGAIGELFGALIMLTNCILAIVGVI